MRDKEIKMRKSVKSIKSVKPMGIFEKMHRLECGEPVQVSTKEKIVMGAIIAAGTLGTIVVGYLSLVVVLSL
jgi:hypothetical protein